MSEKRTESISLVNSKYLLNSLRNSGLSLFTLLTEEWRRNYFDGFNTFAHSRRIPENNGISILRAQREIFYGDMTKLSGTNAKSECMPLDRWWGCEISFPPELDSHFFIGY